jgi:hypothetical protein
MHAALFAVGVAIGLGHVHATRPVAAVQVQTTHGLQVAAMPPAVADTRDAVISRADDSVQPDTIDGPASMAFADAGN